MSEVPLYLSDDLISFRRRVGVSLATCGICPGWGEPRNLWQLLAVWNSPGVGVRGDLDWQNFHEHWYLYQKKRFPYKKEEGGVVGDLRGSIIFRRGTSKSENRFVQQNRKLVLNCGFRIS